MTTASATRALPDTARPERAGRIAFLDYLRIFAFTSVVAGHQFYGYLDAAAHGASTPALLRTLCAALMPFAWSGAAGVTVFFLVSGYIITHVVRGEAPATFALRRVFRIYPLYVVAVVAEAVTAHAVHGTPFPDAATWLPRLLLAGDFFGTPYALKNVEWTLRLEVAFYALMLAARCTFVPRRIAALPAAYLGAGLLLAVLPPFPDFIAWTRGVITVFLPMLFIGSLVYLAERRLANRALAIAVAAVLLVMHYMLSSTLRPASTGHPFVALALGLFVAAWAMRAWLPDLRITRLLASLTYAVYLFHHWLWPYLGDALAGRVGMPLLRDLLVFALLLGLSLVALHLVELPAIRLGTRLSRRRAPLPAGAGPAPRRG